MTDYIAYYKNKPISIYDYKDMIEKDKSIKNEPIYCICGENVFFKNESKYFKRKNSNASIQMICHFSHYKNSNCNINKIFNSTSNFGVTISNSPNKTELEKRMERIDIIIKGYLSGYKKQMEIKTKIFKLDKIININKIDIKLSEELLQLKDNFYYEITFRYLENIIINPNKRYKLIDIINNEKNFGISYSLYNYICSDYEKFKIYVRQLSLIILYYSRCINYNYNNTITHLINDCIIKLQNKINDNPDNIIAIKYLNVILKEF